MPLEVLQAVFCDFRECAARSLCVLLRGSVVVFGSNGSQYSVHLPCEASETRLWPLPRGLLICAQTKRETKFWGLWHPLDEPQLAGTYSSAGSLASTTLSDPGLKLVFSSTEHPFVVLYNTVSRKHSLWSVRAGPADTTAVEPSPDMQLVKILLEPVWEEASISPEATSIFIASDESQRPILCIFCAESSQLNAYNFSSNGLEPAFTISARAAAPICALGNLLQVCLSHNLYPSELSTGVLRFSPSRMKVGSVCMLAHIACGSIHQV